MIKLITGMLTLSLFSCDGNSKLNENNSEPEKFSIQKVKLLTLAELPNEYMEALTSGTLTVNSEGCLKVGKNTIIWPYGYKLGGNKEVIYNAEGNIIVKIGSQVQLSGGECSDCPKEQIKKLTGTLPQDECDGNYWIVGEEIKVK